MTKSKVKEYIIRDTLTYYKACLSFDGYGSYHRKKLKKEISFFLKIELLYFYHKIELTAAEILYREYQNENEIYK